jgi:hypothetical protein
MRPSECRGEVFWPPAQLLSSERDSSRAALARIINLTGDHFRNAAEMVISSLDQLGLLESSGPAKQSSQELPKMLGRSFSVATTETLNQQNREGTWRRSFGQITTLAFI